jgi:hypothetical protein
MGVPAEGCDVARVVQDGRRDEAADHGRHRPVLAVPGRQRLAEPAGIGCHREHVVWDLDLAWILASPQVIAPVPQIR